jgi:hypothetical protein
MFQLITEIVVTHCDTLVTPNVFKLIGHSNHGRRHSRVIYLGCFLNKIYQNVMEPWG